MSAVTYHGEYPEGQVDGEGTPFIVQHGYTFTPGKSVAVTDKADLASFAGNRFFKTPDSDKEDVEQGKDEAEKAEIETLKAWLTDHKIPFHHRAGISTLRTAKADYLEAQAEASQD